jgi:general secretion pathway protein H
MVARVVKVWMRILETGNRNSPDPSDLSLSKALTMRSSRFATGFTLIEILVVLVIVSTVVSITMLSFGILGNDRDLQTEARRFGALAELVRDEASMQGREFGIELMTTSYRFVEYDTYGGRWAEVPGDETLRLRGLPEDVEFELYLEDKRIVLVEDPESLEDPDEDSDRGRAESYSPHLLIYSSGDTTPFELHIWRAFDDERVVLRGDALGMVEILNQDEE